MKFLPVGTLIHAGGQIDGDDKTNSSFAILIPARVRGPFVYSLATNPFQSYRKKKYFHRYSVIQM